MKPSTKLQRQNKRTAIAALVFGTLLWLGSFLFISDMYEGMQSAYWPKTMGLIESHDVARGCLRNRSYFAGLTYRYSVAGQTYHAHQITTTNRFCFPYPEQARDFLLKNYPVGASIAVFYNPQSPDEAVLRAGSYSRFTIVIVVAIWLMAIFLWIAGWKQFKKSSAVRVAFVADSESMQPALPKRTIVSIKFRAGKAHQHDERN
jgi:hypothetical protein